MAPLEPHGGQAISGSIIGFSGERKILQLSQEESYGTLDIFSGYVSLYFHSKPMKASLPHGQGLDSPSVISNLSSK